MRIPFIKQNYCKYLNELPKLTQQASDYKILFSPAAYRLALLELIPQAEKRIYIIALYLEQDEAGREILNQLYLAKQRTPTLDIKIFVDWHRAQRGRIGEGKNATNAHFYYQMKLAHPEVTIPIYGVPINRREILGVLHLKGSIVDDTVLYTGASINNVYLHQLDKYRYDRYHLIKNRALADSLVNYTENYFNASPALQRLDREKQPSRRELKNDIRTFRHQLCHSQYQFTANADQANLAVTPIVGLGRHNLLNNTIHNLLNCTQHKAVLCTPYFNLPTILIKDIIRLLRKGKQVEIIVGDKTANDFYIPEDEPFNIVGGLPYLYEINLRKFMMRLQGYVDQGLLTIRLWKDNDQTYHLKGIWIDNEWILITGNNLNPRAWRLDLENAILVHDPKHELTEQSRQELTAIRENTLALTHYQQIQCDQFYPKPIHKLIKRLSRIRIDRIIKRLL